MGSNCFNAPKTISLVDKILDADRIHDNHFACVEINCIGVGNCYSNNTKYIVEENDIRRLKIIISKIREENEFNKTNFEREKENFEREKENLQKDIEKIKEGKKQINEEKK